MLHGGGQGVLLYAFDRLTYAAIAIDQSIRNEMQARQPGGIEFYTEFLDLDRFRTPEHRQRLASLLQAKYRGKHVDLVIAIDGMSFDFVLPRRADVFPGVPLIFSMAEDSIRVALPPDVGGIVTYPDAAPTIDLALRLAPDTRHLFLIAGSSDLDARWVRFVRSGLSRYDDRLTITPLIGRPLPALLREVQRLPSPSIIFVASFGEDATGRHYRAADAVREIASVANAPVFTGRTSVSGPWEATPTRSTRSPLRSWSVVCSAAAACERLGA